MQCLSCVLEVTAQSVEEVIQICGAPELDVETVAQVLKTSGKAIECIETCESATTASIRTECGTQQNTYSHCKTDFCLMCCGSGDWQCTGNDFTPQCAPSASADEVAPCKCVA